MLKGIEFLRKKSRGFYTSFRSLSSLRVKRSNPSTSPHTLSSLRAQKSNNEKQGEAGRSMVEMLGVLAIIGVLSVGGIAGYSKAMEKWKTNKIIGEYSYLMQGIIEHLSDFEKLKGDDIRYDLLPTLTAMNVIPASWTKAEDYAGHQNLSDSLGNTISVFTRSKRVVLTLLFGASSVSDQGDAISPTFSGQLCKAFWREVLVPLHEQIYYAGVYRSKYYERSNYYFNDKYCGGENLCFSTIKLSDIERVCGACETGEEYCVLTWEFDY